MNKLATLKTLTGVLLAGSAFVVPAQSEAANPVEECSKELLLSYFPEPFVKESLKKFNVPQDKWNSIVKELNEKDREIVKLVEQKATKLSPNPLKDPQQRQAAVKIFRETLTETFSAVLKKNGIADDTQIQQMLDDVQQQKAKRFSQCMEQHRSQPGQATTPGNMGQPQAAADIKSPVTQPKPVAPNSTTPSNSTDGDDDDGDDDDDNDDNDDDDDDDDL